MSDQDNLLLRRAKDLFIDNLHSSNDDWKNIDEACVILTCKDCRKSVIANLQTFELSGEAISKLCPEPPPNR